MTLPPSLRRPLAAAALAVAVAACRSSVPPGAPPSPAAEAAHRAVLAERSIDVAAIPPQSLSVVPLAVPASDTLLSPLAYGLADLLMTDLAHSAQLRLVERLRLDAMLRELQLVKEGVVDPTTAPRLGRLVGARRLVIGALARRPDGRLQVDARVADVATGEVRVAVSASARLIDVLDAEKELALRLFRELGVALTPAERAAVEQRPTKDIGALLAYSRGVRFEVEGRYPAAQREYRDAVRRDPRFGAAIGRLQVVDAELRVASSAQIGRASVLAVDRVNRPFGPVSGAAGNAGAADPAFPRETATVVIIISAQP